jgi:hypothetical protein
MEMDNEELTEEQLRAIRAIRASLTTLGIPAASILPFLNSDDFDFRKKITQQEAMRMFPQADPNLFQPFKSYLDDREVVPLTQQTALNRVFRKNIERNSPLSAENIYKSKLSFPEYSIGRPKAPSPELGSFANAISNKTIFPEGDIQAITVTPGPNPKRFAQNYAEIILADKLGKTLNEFESRGEWNSEAAQQARKIAVLSRKIPGTAGYVWGNTDRPQYTYAEGNRRFGENLAGENPSIYLSRINADPSKEANYLFTRDILPAGGTIDPRAEFKQYKELGPGTGPSWGVAPNDDISFRKDLIGARGELTTGDLQALLAKRGLPFEYQVQGKRGPTKKPGDVLRANLERLASSENISSSQAAVKYARLIPNVGESVIPPTAAISGRIGEFPVEEQMASPFGRFAGKTDLRQIGILPPGDKTTYSLFDIDRDVLRPKAANKLLNETTRKLIEQAKPVKGMGLGGLAAGGISTAMDPAVIDAVARGDYLQAGTTAALNTGISSVVGGIAAKGLQALQAAGYARPAALIGSALPVAAGVLGGLGIVEAGKAFNRAYRAQTGKDWVRRNQPLPDVPFFGPIPTIEPRLGIAIRGGKRVKVPYGSVAGEKLVGRPWWIEVGSRIENFLNF